MKSKLKHPVFIFSILLLLLNDFYLKYAFPGLLTGKLSDFAGLFAFAYFFSSLLPRYKKQVHIVIAVLFIFWKSSYSQPLIDTVNSVGVPINRVVDQSDNIALISLLLSYFLFSKFKYKEINPILKYAIMGVSLFSFIATSQRPIFQTTPTYKFVNIENSYQFPYSKEKLIERYNNLQMERVNYLKKYYAGTIVFDSIGHTYLSDHKYIKEAIAKILDYNKLKDTDTIRIDDENTHFYITGDNHSSKINLTSIIKYGYLPDTIIIDRTADSIPPLYNDLIQLFEDRIIKKLNNN
ncbi:hypothetical protein G7050_09285 [Dysgonomonas sp. HDW5A]|uniref:hypothetical protein n=1 Tax=unclassified Dysgonomonas TaxID=2630389 RepID=UPI001409EB7B|nr:MULTISPECIES: hypothetical protein [unclassified Dysgonomonas]QIK54588.1 hypothetical protein G7051_09625 [Dysgonomonas sp. HDW5B]QIK60014.1 hypothetical protein G7050_09285 [Dysgonomonas sp. HDW5A]